MIRITLVILLALFSSTSALIPCTPNICNLVDCQDVSLQTCEKEEREFRPKSSACGCCHRCIDYIGASESCPQMTRPRVMGGPPRLEKHCKPGYFCSEGRCRSRITEE